MDGNANSRQRNQRRMFQMREYPRMRVVPSGTWNKTGTREHSKNDRVPDEAQGGKGKE